MSSNDALPLYDVVRKDICLALFDVVERLLQRDLEGLSSFKGQSSFVMSERLHNRFDDLEVTPLQDLKTQVQKVLRQGRDDGSLVWEQCGRSQVNKKSPRSLNFEVQKKDKTAKVRLLFTITVEEETIVRNVSARIGSVIPEVLEVNVQITNLGVNRAVSPQLPMKRASDGAAASNAVPDEDVTESDSDNGGVGSASDPVILR
jgi:hypothetical protein